MSITVSMHLSDYEELCEKHNKDIYVLEQKVKDMELILNGDFQTAGLRKELAETKANYAEAYRQLSVVQKELAACKHELEHAQKSYTDILKRCTGQEELIEEQRKCITKKMEQIQIGDDTINEQEKVKKALGEDCDTLAQKVKELEATIGQYKIRSAIADAKIAEQATELVQERNSHTATTDICKRTMGEREAHAKTIQRLQKNLRRYKRKCKGK